MSPQLALPLRIAPKRIQKLGYASIRRFGTLTARWRPLPDFVIIGAKRTGTTTLYRALEEHPGTRPLMPRFAKLKSPHYHDLHYDEGPAWYRGHFPIRWPGDSSVRGEGNPYCLVHPLAPKRVYETSPDTLLLVCLRNPAERALSHHWDRVREGIETLSLEEAVAAEPERIAGLSEALERGDVAASDAFEHFSYVTRGHYAEQLERWLRYFPPEQLIAIRSEDLYHGGQAVMDRVYDALGLAPHVPSLGRHHQRTDRPPFDDAARDLLAPYFEESNRRLAELLGTPLWWDASGPTDLDGVGVASPTARPAVAAPTS